ncbi:hypothetical protein ACH5RR_008856 [Cinchona calisaya]|uniref:Uncharacterized protein n=1 Tax=Cinchona calisaya TaxID=153742 RepID=A0ABD3AEB4_9GENT
MRPTADLVPKAPEKVQGQKGRITGNLFIDCNDSGALFVEAKVHSRFTQAAIPIEELNQYMPLEPCIQYLVLDPNAIGNNIPLAIQFNSFECGGTAVGVCISHKIADAISMVTFMNTWAAKSLGKTEDILHPSFHLAGHLFPQMKILSFLVIDKT